MWSQLFIIKVNENKSSFNKSDTCFCNSLPFSSNFVSLRLPFFVSGIVVSAIKYRIATLERNTDKPLNVNADNFVCISALLYTKIRCRYWLISLSILYAPLFITTDDIDLQPHEWNSSALPRIHKPKQHKCTYSMKHSIWEHALILVLCIYL